MEGWRVMGQKRGEGARGRWVEERGVVCTLKGMLHIYIQRVHMHDSAMDTLPHPPLSIIRTTCARSAAQGIDGGRR